MLGEPSTPPSEARVLEGLIDNPKIEEVWVNGPNTVFVAEGGVSRSVPMVVLILPVTVIFAVYPGRLAMDLGM